MPSPASCCSVNAAADLPGLDAFSAAVASSSGNAVPAELEQLLARLYRAWAPPPCGGSDGGFDAARRLYGSSRQAQQPHAITAAHAQHAGVQHGEVLLIGSRALCSSSQRHRRPIQQRQREQPQLAAHDAEQGQRSVRLLRQQQHQQHQQHQQQRQPHCCLGSASIAAPDVQAAAAKPQQRRQPAAHARTKALHAAAAADATATAAATVAATTAAAAAAQPQPSAVQLPHFVGLQPCCCAADTSDASIDGGEDSRQQAGPVLQQQLSAARLVQPPGLAASSDGCGTPSPPGQLSLRDAVMTGQPPLRRARPQRSAGTQQPEAGRPTAPGAACGCAEAGSRGGGRCGRSSPVSAVRSGSPAGSDGSSSSSGDEAGGGRGRRWEVPAYAYSASRGYVGGLAQGGCLYLSTR